MKRPLLLMLTMMLISCSSMGALPANSSSVTPTLPRSQPGRTADQTHFFTSLQTLQAAAPFSLMVPAPEILPKGLKFQGGQMIPDPKRTAVSQMYADEDPTDQRREVTIQQTPLPGALQPPRDPYTSLTVRGHAAYLVTLPTAPDLHALIWEEDGYVISVSGNVRADELQQIAAGLSVST